MCEEDLKDVDKADRIFECLFQFYFNFFFFFVTDPSDKGAPSCLLGTALLVSRAVMWQTLAKGK